MKNINNSRLRSLFPVLSLLLVLSQLQGQTTMPEVLTRNNLQEQMKYLEERTKIYENYRAIREDMFQKVKGNISDTLTHIYGKLNLLNTTLSLLNHKIDSISMELERTKSALEAATTTKNSINVFGIEVNKITYNTIMWFIILGLSALLVMGFLAFKRNLSLISHSKKELEDLKDEFQAYRKSSREAREKMSMDHFNEIRRLKGG